eukprot:4285535-Amphidinium_carterae.1
MTCMLLLITTLLRSHFATNTVGTTDYGEAMDRQGEQVGVHPELGQYPSDIYRLPERDGGDDGRNYYDLSEHTLQYYTHLPGDTEEDDKRIEQVQALEDDIQSIDDEEYDK